MFGPQRSGTNYLQQLIAQNFVGVGLLNRDPINWKHSITVPNQYNTTVMTIILSKNPYMWVESVGIRDFVDWPVRQTQYSIVEPCDPEYTLIASDKTFYKIPDQKVNMLNLCRAYHDFYTNWLPMIKYDNISHIRYEDIIEKRSRESTLETIQRLGSFDRKNDIWVNPSPGSISQSNTYNIEREKYYRSLTPKYLTTKQIQKINEIVGVDVITKLGYEILTEGV